MGRRLTPSHSINHVATLARDASMSTSYKPALLKALLRIAGRDSGRNDVVALQEIGSEFVVMYWVQTVVFRLRQAATIGSEPEVVRHIRSVADVYGVRDLAALPPHARASLDAQMARILKINVLNRFHASKPVEMNPLFTWTERASFLTLSSGAASFLAEHRYALESIANLWWARYLEKVNLLAPLVIEKVERNGAQRGSLAKFLRVLRLVDEPRCFYCECALQTSDGTHVDHIIPWSFILADPLWDLVLSCARCNLAKSDSLPKRRFLDKLFVVGTRRSQITLPPGFASALFDRDDVDRVYDAALSVEWPAGWEPAPA